jgi:TRAP-type C4-dicarboxylate transport system substrate-binding protein
MRSRKGRAGLTTLAVAATVAMLTVGCSGGEPASNKAGGAAAPVTLKMANPYGDLNLLPAVAYFVSQVQDRSGGNLRIDVTSTYGDYADDAEQQVVRGVAAGQMDLGWAGARVFDTMGVTAFQALQAPMLIDSYPLEQAVITAGIPGEMLPSLEKIGVQGLGVVGDGLRKPVAVKRPLLSLDDWRGITFATLKSQGQADAIRALGANPIEAFRNNRNKGLTSGKLAGLEMNLLTYEHSVPPQSAPYVTANVSLWPQLDVLVANPERLANLSEQQRHWLNEAAKDAVDRSVGLIDHDEQSLQNACKAGARFANASKADLAGLNKAFAPVYASLEKDAGTMSFIQKIQELKRSTPPGTPLAIPAGCTGKAPAQSTNPSGLTPASLNGTYRYELTKEDARKFNDPEIDAFPHVNTVKLLDGQVDGGCFGHQGATYSVTGNRIAFVVPEDGVTLTFTFTVDAKHNLHLRPVEPMNPGDVLECSYEPWIKIG